MVDYVPPEVGESGFHCPYCDTYASQIWRKLDTSLGNNGRQRILSGTIGFCAHCQNHHLWVDGEMVYPPESSAPKPAEDMPDNVRKDFNEARQVVDDSPKAAAALLRLAMEKLTQELTGNENQSLYQNIGDLVEDGRVDKRIQQALDAVRVTGNDYVHAGEIYNPDDRETALRLFDLVNTIVELTISREKLIEEAYAEIPDNKKAGIEQRDKN